jgi:hypothetical protein
MGEHIHDAAFNFSEDWSIERDNRYQGAHYADHRTTHGAPPVCSRKKRRSTPSCRVAQFHKALRFTSQVLKEKSARHSSQNDGRLCPFEFELRGRS